VSKKEEKVEEEEKEEEEEEEKEEEEEEEKEATSSNSRAEMWRMAATTRITSVCSPSDMHTCHIIIHSVTSSYTHTQTTRITSV
jgi:hypothetical protein